MPKKRLDQLVQEMAPAYSRRHVQSFIMQGFVKVDGRVITKPGMQFKDGVQIDLDIRTPKYVSRAGNKLEKALEHFNIDAKDLVILDSGLSTGGFTDCLLQHGARKVYGVDVGRAQVVDKIKNDPRVVAMERTNLKDVESVGELVDMITLDLSFISVLKVMDTIDRVLKPEGKLIVLIKPQFEAEKHEVGRGGIVKDEAVHEKVVEKVKFGIEERGYTLQGVTDSPITGADGNKEFLAYFVRDK